MKYLICLDPFYYIKITFTFFNPVKNQTTLVFGNHQVDIYLFFSLTIAFQIYKILIMQNIPQNNKKSLKEKQASW